jgi:hypothetical protein
MNASFRPDYGLALAEAGVASPVDICPLVLEDVGRVAEDTYTISGQVLHEDNWHMASLDLAASLLPHFLATLPREEAEVLAMKLRRPWRGPFMEKLASPASLGVRAKLGEPQYNGQERFVPFVGLQVS